MITRDEVLETNDMIDRERLDVRTITMGISLLDCVSGDVDMLCRNIHRRIVSLAGDLVSTGDSIAREYGIPIVNKRITVTPISLVAAGACHTVEDYVAVAKALDRSAGVMPLPTKAE